MLTEALAEVVLTRQIKEGLIGLFEMGRTDAGLR